jgi:hypothetical protein
MINLILYVLQILALAAFVLVWIWGMWAAFTQGDDHVARFGRELLKRFGVKKYRL